MRIITSEAGGFSSYPGVDVTSWLRRYYLTGYNPLTNAFASAQPAAYNSALYEWATVPGYPQHRCWEAEDVPGVVVPWFGENKKDWDPWWDAFRQWLRPGPQHYIYSLMTHPGLRWWSPDVQQVIDDWNDTFGQNALLGVGVDWYLRGDEHDAQRFALLQAALDGIGRPVCSYVGTRLHPSVGGATCTAGQMRQQWAQARKAGRVVALYDWPAAAAPQAWRVIYDEM